MSQIIIDRLVSDSRIKHMKTQTPLDRYRHKACRKKQMNYSTSPCVHDSMKEQIGQVRKTVDKIAEKQSTKHHRHTVYAPH